MKDQARAILSRAAADYLGTRPWKDLTTKDWVIVRDAASGIEAAATVLGSDGEEYGLGLYFGREGVALLEEMLEGQMSEEEVDRLSDVVALTVVDVAEAPRIKPGNVLDGRVEVEGKTCVPTVFRVEPGATARPLKDPEALHLARVLAGLARTVRQGLTRADVLDRAGARLILELSGDQDDLRVESRREEAGVTLDPATELALNGLARTKRGLVAIAGDAVVFVDPKEGVVFESVLEDASPLYAASRVVAGLAGRLPARRPPRLPREVHAAPAELATILGVVLRPFGVKVSHRAAAARDVERALAAEK